MDRAVAPGAYHHRDDLDLLVPAIRSLIAGLLAGCFLRGYGFTRVSVPRQRLDVGYCARDGFSWLQFNGPQTQDVARDSHSQLS